MNPPEHSRTDVLAEQAARFVGSSAQVDTTPVLIVLVWGRRRFRHFLSDGGVDRNYLKESLPDARLYLVTASVRRSAPSADPAESLPPSTVLSVRVRRQMERVYCMPRNVDGPAWEAFRIADGALRPHASVPIL